VATARDGGEGLRAFGERPADVVVCDVFLPGLDGLEVIRRLREGSPGVRVVAITAGSYGRELDPLSAALDLGADGALHKPFTPGELLHAVEPPARGGA
jgi:two-component system response regulator MprA